MKRILNLILIVAAAAALAGCSRYTLINSTAYDSSALWKTGTFRIVNLDEGKIPPGLTTETYYTIASDIRAHMASLGYREDPSSPLMVNFGITVSKDIVTEPVIPPNYYPFPGPYPGPVPGYYPFFMYPRQYYLPPYYSNAVVVTGMYRQGVLTMDMVSVPDRKLLYTSSVATRLNSQNGYGDPKELANAVDALFARYPQRVGK